MKSATASNPFRDAMVLSGLTFAEAADVLERSQATIQSYASGKREPPPELVSHLCTMAWDVLHTNDVRDRHGVLFPPSALAMRRASKNPAVRKGFDAIREAQHRNPQPDPDASPNTGPEPDFEHDDGDERCARPSCCRSPPLASEACP